MPEKQKAPDYTVKEIELLTLPIHESYFQQYTPVNTETETPPPPLQDTPDDTETETPPPPLQDTPDDAETETPPPPLQDTPDDAEPDWEFLPPSGDSEYGPATPEDSGAAQTPAANEQPGPTQLAPPYLESMQSFTNSVRTVLSSASNDLANGSEHIGRLTSRYLDQSTSALPSPVSLAIRAGVEAIYIATQQLSSAVSHLPGLLHDATAMLPNAMCSFPAASGPASVHLNEPSVPATSDEIQAEMYQAFLLAKYPDLDMIDCEDDEPLDASQAAEDADDPGIDTSSMPPQHSAPAPESVGPASQDPFADKSDESPTDEEQDEDESEDSEDSQEYHECEGASDADDAEDPDGPAGSGGSTGSDGSKDSDDADSPDDASTRGTDDTQQTPPGNQQALKDFTIPVAFLLAAPDLHSENDAAMPGDGPALSTAALAVGLAAVTAYLIGTEMPDWSACDCQLVGQPLNLLAGLMV